MTFCTKCGTPISDNATVCPSCGQVRGAAGYTAPASPSAGPQYAPPSSVSPGVTPPVTANATGFLASLFDFSFTSFITTKLIKVLYALGVIIAGFTALMLVIAGFTRGALAGLLVLIIVAPLVFFLYVIYWRVLMELIIVIFRGAEHLAEITRQGRHTAGTP